MLSRSFSDLQTRHDSANPFRIIDLAARLCANAGAGRDGCGYLTISGHSTEKDTLSSYAALRRDQSSISSCERL
jgi:hypothetical protein